VELEPTAFHRRLRDTLREQEPGLFKWYGSDTYETERLDRLRLELLRSSYRLSADNHERPHRLAREAGLRIGVDVPITLYQLHQGEGMNAGLCFARDEAHIVISGNLLGTLDDAELLALFGHELSHHRLFTLEDGTYRITADLIEASAVHAGSSAAFAEAALRNRRWTEIFADRGSVIAAGGIEPAISCLLKVRTGLSQVSVPDYLVQAREIVAKLAGQEHDKGDTHPEHAVRAMALEVWFTNGDPDQIEDMLEGAITLETLDIVQQDRLTQRTRRMLDHVLAPPWVRTEATLAHARRFFPNYEWQENNVRGEVRSDSIDEYLAFILLDFAVIDESLGEVALARSLTIANELGIRDMFATLAKKELKLTATALNQLEERAPTLFERAEKDMEVLS
jgi:Zn-dependent protease with chaperone function